MVGYLTSALLAMKYRESCMRWTTRAGYQACKVGQQTLPLGALRSEPDAKAPAQPQATDTPDDKLAARCVSWQPLPVPREASRYEAFGGNDLRDLLS